jgi:hypothetical protein
MDKKQDWSWLPAQMPGVAKLMASKRAELGADHVRECWKRGVVQRERGWFYAAEGALAVGTPFDEPDLQPHTLPQYTAGQAVLILRPVEAVHAAD